MSDIKDVSIAEQGEARVEWALKEMGNKGVDARAFQTTTLSVPV